MIRRIVSLSVPGVLLFSLAHSVSVSSAEKQDTGGRQRTLVIGRVSDNPKKHYGSLKSIVDYVASNLQDVGIEKGSVLMAKDNRELIEYLKDGKVDWVTETVFSALLYHEQTGAEIILRRWKRKVPNYYTVFFTRKDNGIESLKDLKGKRIAFEDPGSTTAYFVPVAVLKKAQLDLVQISSPKDKPPMGKIGYVFAGGELNIADWVHRRMVDAGAFSNLDWEDPDDTTRASRKDLKIFYQSKAFPRAVELMRKNLDPSIKHRIKEILLKSPGDSKARAALRAYDKTTNFDEIAGDAKKGLDEARQLLRFVRGEIK